MTAAVAVVAGGIGAVVRYWVTGAAQRRGRWRFPSGTLVVNLIGSFLVGVAAAATPSGSVTQAAAAGILGGFTTFSTWSAESLAMLRTGQYVVTGLNLAGMLAGGICLCALGYFLAH